MSAWIKENGLALLFITIIGYVCVTHFVTALADVAHLNTNDIGVYATSID